MTNKECIEILKTLPLRIDLDGYEDSYDALDMAIYVLEEKDYWENYKGGV